MKYQKSFVKKILGKNVCLFPDGRLTHFVLVIHTSAHLKSEITVVSRKRCPVLVLYKYLSELLLRKFTLSRRKRDKDYYQVISIESDCYTAV